MNVEDSEQRPPTARVFISSTVEDLSPHRAVAREAVLTCELQPVMMEYFAAKGDRPPLADCLEKVAGSDLVIVIAGERYGWVPDEQLKKDHKSITWLECEHAAGLGKEVIPFLIDEKQGRNWDLRESIRLAIAAEQQTFNNELAQEVLRNINKLKEFKAWLNARSVRATFTSPEDLRRQIEHALNQWKHRPASRRSASHEGAVKNLKPYLGWLYNSANYIDLRSFRPGVSSKRPPIDALYVPLPVRSSGTGLDSASGGDRNDRRGPDDIDSVLDDHLGERRLVIVGEAGSGKTTFLRHVATAAVERLLETDPPQSRVKAWKQAAGRLPVFVRLVEFWEHIRRSQERKLGPLSSSSPEWLIHYLDVQGSEMNWGLDGLYFRDRLNRGLCLALFDGLDGIHDRGNRESMARLIHAISQSYPMMHCIVTSRDRVYTRKATLPDFQVLEIAPLQKRAIKELGRNWCAAFQVSRAKEADLLKTISSKSYATISRTPVLVAAVASLCSENRYIPRTKADVYEGIVTWLAEAPEASGGLTADQLLARLQRLALAMQDDAAGPLAAVPQDNAVEVLFSKTENPGMSATERSLDVEIVSGGLLMSERAGPRQAGFANSGFQDYLAARAISEFNETELARFLLDRREKIGLPEWRETIVFLAGIAGTHPRNHLKTILSAIVAASKDSARLSDQLGALMVMGAILKEIPSARESLSESDLQFLRSTGTGIFCRQATKELDFDSRIAAANALGLIGDPRVAVDNWVHIQGMSFAMGAQSLDPAGRNFDPLAAANESPVHTVSVADFDIGRYPVTVGEFMPFVAQGGYQNSEWWREGGFGSFTAPARWETQVETPNHPVTGVSWYEASAYCLWRGVRLPTEAEWERAARSGSRGNYPWGDTTPDELTANHDRLVSGTTPVGLFPWGNTASGICDLSGNCWEWVSDTYKAPGDATDSAGARRLDSERVARGGSWSNSARFLRVSERVGGRANSRYLNFGMIGFRCVLQVRET